MPKATVDDMLELAKRLAREAAAIALPRLGRANAKRKFDGSVVTETDHAIESHILKAIAHNYADHTVCAEEASALPQAQAPSPGRYCWVVDPLDGTRNFAAGLPCFSTSIAVLDAGRPSVAVSLEHNVDLLYAGEVGLGATLNDAPVRVVDVSEGCDMLVAVPSSKDRVTVSVMTRWIAMPHLICRNFGSTTWHLGLLASGALSAVFSKRAKIWDVAAGALLVTEAGGRITDLDGKDLVPFDLSADPNADLPFLAAAPQTHQRLLSSIREVSSSP